MPAGAEAALWAAIGSVAAARAAPADWRRNVRREGWGGFADESVTDERLKEWKISVNRPRIVSMENSSLTTISALREHSAGDGKSGV
jgi:hypothetical protein